MINGNQFVILHYKTPFTQSREAWHVYGPMSKIDAENLVEKLRQKEMTISVSVGAGDIFFSQLNTTAKEHVTETVCRL